MTVTGGAPRAAHPDGKPGKLRDMVGDILMPVGRATAMLVLFEIVN
jgi:hypothetical protein